MRRRPHFTGQSPSRQRNLLLLLLALCLPGSAWAQSVTFTGSTRPVAGTRGAQNLVTDGGDSLFFSLADGLYIQVGAHPAVRVMPAGKVPGDIALFGPCVLLLYDDPNTGSFFRAVTPAGALVAREAILEPESAGKLIHDTTGSPVLATISGDRFHLIGRRVDPDCTLGAPFDILDSPAGAIFAGHAEAVSPLTGEIGVVSAFRRSESAAEIDLSRFSAGWQPLAGPVSLNPPGINVAENPSISYDPEGNGYITFSTAGPGGTGEYSTFLPLSGPASTAVLSADSSGQVRTADRHTLAVAPGLLVVTEDVIQPSAFHLVTNAVLGAQRIGSAFQGFIQPIDDLGGGFTAFPVLRRLGQELDVVSLFEGDVLAPSGAYQRPFIVASPCVADDTTLCLHGGRFRVNVSDLAPGGQAGYGHAVRVTDDSGYFWFFGAANVEAFVKVVDGCSLNNNFWVFDAGFTNVKTIVSVTDSETGLSRSYVNPPDTAFRPTQDTSAFSCSTPAAAAVLAVARRAAAPAAPAATSETAPAATSAAALVPPQGNGKLAVPAGTCAPDAATLCLNSSRFAVTTDFRTPAGQTGSGVAIPLTADTGFFWFFSPDNVEVVVKVLNACDVNGGYWVFAGGLTNIAVTTTVTDTATGRTRRYRNPPDTLFQPVQDTSGLPVCP
ncbi:MAG TPA: hypothetical protein VHR45_23780 [Thermoanaerobaculia bacterium]|nr:hypothetical protein [Thermoanaerobaculia bacterium]